MLPEPAQRKGRKKHPRQASAKLLLIITYEFFTQDSKGIYFLLTIYIYIYPELRRPSHNLQQI